MRTTHKMNWSGLGLLFFLFGTTISSTAVAQDEAARQPRIAIGNFDYKGVWPLGDGTSAFVDMISTSFIKTRQFQLVERDRVNEALREMGLGEAGVVDPADCQKLGTLLKADLILFGTITQASLDKKDVAIAGLNTVREDMRMAVDVRVIDAKTGEIKTAETISRSKTASKDVRVAGAITTGEGSSGIVGDVMRDVANSIVEKLVSNIYPITVVTVREGQVQLSYGEPMVTAGATYGVYDGEGFPVGKVQVTEVQNRSALGTILSGTVAEGMICRKETETTSPKVQTKEIPW